MEKGRQLKSLGSNTYTYNANGIRTSKTINGVTHTYTLDGTKILREVWGNNTLVPLYDNEDSVCGILYNNMPFYFLKNLQGDIIAIVDKDAQTVARYSYDAWGAVTNAVTYTDLTNGVEIATINPFCYRGYYYDEEIGLYYVSSRYYDPEIGRWLNSDDAQFVSFSESLLSSNLFCYCHNSSINNIDENGKWLARVIGAVAVGAIFATLAYVVLKVVNAILKSVGRSPLSKKITTLITVGVGALGAVIGAILGPSFLVKYAPNLLKAINQIEKTKFSIKTIKPNSHGNIFGINISNTLIIMLHYPHAGKNEWNFHVQVEIHLFGKKQKEIGRWILLDVNKSTWEKWRRYFGNK